MMSVSFPVVPQKTLRLTGTRQEKHLSIPFIHKVYKSSNSKKKKNFEVSGPFCTTHEICGQRENKSKRRTEGEEEEE
jgi:hypothetical protein